MSRLRLFSVALCCVFITWQYFAIDLSTRRITSGLPAMNVELNAADFKKKIPCISATLQHIMNFDSLCKQWMDAQFSNTSVLFSLSVIICCHIAASWHPTIAVTLDTYCVVVSIAPLSMTVWLYGCEKMLTKNNSLLIYLSYFYILWRYGYTFRYSVPWLVVVYSKSYLSKTVTSKPRLCPTMNCAHVACLFIQHSYS